MAVVFYQELADIGVFQGDVAFDNVGVDIDRRLIFPSSTHGICLVDSVPEDRAGVPRVGPTGSPSIPFVDAGICQRGEGCRDNEGFDEEGLHSVGKNEKLQTNVSRSPTRRTGRSYIIR